MSTPPNKDAWHSEPWCLDAETACEHFNGKTLDEAISMFTENALDYQEDLMFMPATCFRYYLPAYLQYLMSEASRGDSDGASSVFGLVDHRLEDLFRDATLLRHVTKTIAHMGERQSWYDADESLYGSFRRKADRLLSKLQR